jgi:uncharacterized Zn-binding protein involved in type VI secretion
MHVCPAPGHIGGPVVITGQNFVKVNGVPIATVGDQTLCTGVPMNAAITGGSGIARINGRKVVRVTDSCEHGGKLVQGVMSIRFE